MNSNNYTWVPFYQEMCPKLLQYSPAELISFIKQVLDVQNLVGIEDKDKDGNKFELADMDPYTFLSFINKLGNTKRLAVLALLKDVMHLTAPAPTDVNGIPTAQAQSVWMFAYSYHRQPADIEQLRTLYRQVEDGTLTSDLFDQVRQIRQVGPAKLTEALFCQKPTDYLPINGQTKPWLAKRNLPYKYVTLSDYHKILDAVRQHDPRPFYELSWEAYQENNPTAQTDTTRYFCVGVSFGDQGDQLDRFKQEGIWENGYGDDQPEYQYIIKTLPVGTKLAAKSSYTSGPRKESVSQLDIKAIGVVTGNPGDGKTLEVIWDDDFEPFTLTGKGSYRKTIQAVTKPGDIQLIFFHQYNQPVEPVATRYYWSVDIGGESDHLDQFIQEGYWEGPWAQQQELNEPFYIDFMQEIPVGSKLALQYCAVPPEEETEYSFQIVAIGEVTFNPGNGDSLLVDWVPDFKPFTLTFDTNYDGEFIALIEEITRPDHIQQIFFHQSDQPVTPVSTVQSKYAKNIILYGPPGTGKTYGTIDLAVEIVDGRKSTHHKINKPRFDQLRKEEQIEFITFHQNYTYEDFVMGLKPDVDGETLTFQRSYGIFYKVAKRARDNYEASRATGKATVTVKPFQEVFDEFMKPLVEAGTEIDITMASGIKFALTEISERSINYRKSNGSTLHTLSIATLKKIYDGVQEISPNGLKPYYRPLSEELIRLGRQTRQNVPLKNYVLIIDEINRANMSRVFGELITLLEDDKRLGADNELTVTLPSGEPFSVPPNLYLIGTMNTADKSLALLDIALRRRFDFLGKYPDYSLLDEPAKGILERLNKVIVVHKKSADFQIGHAYFINKPADQLNGIMDNRVIPLLMEYFNGRSDMVERILTEADIPVVKNSNTLQLQTQVQV